MSTEAKRRYVLDPRYSVGPMDTLYDLVFERLEQRFDGEECDRFAAWLRAVRPSLAHMAVMMVEMALSGQPMGKVPLSLIGFKPNGEPIVG